MSQFSVNILPNIQKILELVKKIWIIFFLAMFHDKPHSIILVVLIYHALFGFMFLIYPSKKTLLLARLLPYINNFGVVLMVNNAKFLIFYYYFI